jgi:hypothetical protein
MNYQYMTYIIENNEDFKIAEVEAPESAKLSDVQKIEYQSQLSLYNSQQTILQVKNYRSSHLSWNTYPKTQKQS